MLPLPPHSADPGEMMVALLLSGVEGASTHDALALVAVRLGAAPEYPLGRELSSASLGRASAATSAYTATQVMEVP